jgi:predicted AAA+ superfamily ATPase
MIWQAEDGRFLPVPQVNRTPIALLKSVDRMRDTLLARGLHLATADGGFDPEAEV